MGLVDQRWPISARHERAPAWGTLDKAKQKEMDERMAIYAAMIDSMDQAIGHILKAVADLGQTENTVVLFLADNGSCDESGCTDSSAKRAASWARTVPLPATASAGPTPATRRSSFSRKQSRRRHRFAAHRSLAEGIEKRLTASYGMNRRVIDIMACVQLAGRNILRAFADTTSAAGRAQLVAHL